MSSALHTLPDVDVPVSLVTTSSPEESKILQTWLRRDGAGGDTPLQTLQLEQLFERGTGGSSAGSTPTATNPVEHDSILDTVLLDRAPVDGFDHGRAAVAAKELGEGTSSSSQEGAAVEGAADADQNSVSERGTSSAEAGVVAGGSQQSPSEEAAPHDVHAGHLRPGRIELMELKSKGASKSGHNLPELSHGRTSEAEEDSVPQILEDGPALDATAWTALRMAAGGGSNVPYAYLPAGGRLVPAEQGASASARYAGRSPYEDQHPPAPRLSPTRNAGATGRPDDGGAVFSFLTRRPLHPPTGLQQRRTKTSSHGHSTSPGAGENAADGVAGAENPANKHHLDVFLRIELLDLDRTPDTLIAIREALGSLKTRQGTSALDAILRAELDQRFYGNLESRVEHVGAIDTMVRHVPDLSAPEYDVCIEEELFLQEKMRHRVRVLMFGLLLGGIFAIGVVMNYLVFPSYTCPEQVDMVAAEPPLLLLDDLLSTPGNSPRRGHL